MVGSEEASKRNCITKRIALNPKKSANSDRTPPKRATGQKRGWSSFLNALLKTSGPEAMNTKAINQCFIPLRSFSPMPHVH